MTILHVDMDAFYASVEQRDRPELRGRPVINHGTRSAQTKGKIGIFSFKAEIFFRSLALRPLTKK
jgi:DNA polymerase IV